ncbi:hypothetical protein LZ575_02055 [Antarcticibacterium sp. 1MA-6-2]|nr:hypothetical protein [Antarcticibacterium sp. 1MA-6-2]UJH91540.1 hypothetical protein LZ575_02055 [Antarcticibacterium sp. 1MA-6-2]
MKFKAIFCAATIFGATFFVTTTTENNNNDKQIEKQAVDRSKLKIPTNG